MNTLPLLSENRQKLLHKAHQKKYRDQLQLYFGEGYRLLTAAFEQPGTKIQEIILSERVLSGGQGALIRKTADQRRIPLYRSTERQMNRLSAEVTPPGIFFTVARAAANDPDLNSCSDRVIVFLEQISDAGNLGTILRSMAWFGLTSLILSPASVDAYNPKSVRASAGAIFGAKIYPNLSFGQAVAQLKPRDYKVYAAVPEGGRAIGEADSGHKILLAFGSEAGGLSDSILTQADQRITIPRRGNIESLNLAVSAGIIFSQITTGNKTDAL